MTLNCEPLFTQGIIILEKGSLMNDLNYINEFCQHGLMLTMHNSDFQQKERILRLPRAVTKWN